MEIDLVATPVAKLIGLIGPDQVTEPQRDDLQNAIYIGLIRKDHFSRIPIASRTYLLAPYQEFWSIFGAIILVSRKSRAAKIL